MLFSTDIKSADVAETLRSTDIIKTCAEQLRDECRMFEFDLEGTFNSAEDMHISYAKYVESRPQLWEKFFNIMFPYRTKSLHIQRKCDTLFQIIHYILHNGRKHNPFHVSLAELIHDNSRSKILIQIMNKLGLCISYDELERIDFGLAQRIIDATGSNRTPVPLTIDSSSIIHGVKDNFDHDEGTSSGIGGSHDTILMLFQNKQNVTEEPQKEVSQKPQNSSKNRKSLINILPCQKLVRRGKFGGRGRIPESFLPGQEIDFSPIANSSARRQSMFKIKDGSVNIPSFAAMKSLLVADTHVVTKCAFTPILPYPATEFDSIFTTMINFQDLLKQKQRNNGPLWSDEGVYHVAKEIQLCHPEKFSNIFLGIGGFHLKKVVIGCLGAYLESSGIQNIMVEEEIFGSAVVNSVMNGGNYIRGKRGMSLIAEAMEQLQMKAFLQCDGVMFRELFEKIDQLQLLMGDPNENKENITEQWIACLKELDTFEVAFNEFKITGCKESDLFAYWNNFVSNIAPVLRDLTRSFREADWNLHLSSVTRAIELCFSFDRINYKRWLPLYYEDCLALPERFPDIYAAFKKGDFVVRHSLRKGSAVPMDQALEKESGIIGFTRRKDAVCKWNLIKHEKANYRSFLYTTCQMDEDDEYSLHYEFSKPITVADQKSVASLMDNILQRGKPFDTEEPKGISNIATGAKLDKEVQDFLLNCISLGKAARDEFYESRLKEKTLQLFDTIPKTMKKNKKITAQIKYDVNKETVKFLRHIDYARLRQFDLELLMESEITPISFYLTKDGLIRKPNKSEFTKELKTVLSKPIPTSLPSTNHQRAIIINFMAYARKVPIKKQYLKTYNDFFTSLWRTFISLSGTCNRVDIVFDVYKEHSIKCSERRRRTKVEGIETMITDFDQPLPVEIDRFWPVSRNKITFQQLFTQWTLKKVK